MEREKLKNIIKKTPASPGVYIFKGSGNRKLYIGKAFRLKQRLSNYLNSKDTRIRKMLEESKNLSIIETPSDIEALILESQMIKKERPEYNIVMRDDKQYFYVGFTDEQFPRIFITHQPTILNLKFKILKTKSADADFIGPFTDGSALKSTLRYLRKVFPYCTCKKAHNNFCLNYHIGKCLGFCCLKNIGATREEKQRYDQNIRSIKEILSGKRNTIAEELKKDMEALARKEIFEEALLIQRKIDQLNRIFENARIISSSSLIDGDEDTAHGAIRPDLKKLKEVLGLKKIPRRIEGYDISNIQGDYAVGAMVVFTDGRVNKNEHRKFKIKKVKGANDTAMLKEILVRRFNHPEWRYPDLIIIDGGKGQLNAALSVTAKNIPIVSLVKDERHVGTKILTSKGREIMLKNTPFPARNLLLAVDDEAHRFAIKFYRQIHQRSLILPSR